jgi:DNA-binding transcriptional ArsR family regulator
MMADIDLAAVAELMSAKRAGLLLALIGGRPLSAGELAARTGMSASLASSHLSKLLDGGLVAVVQHGRERHYELAGPHVAEVIESMLTIAPPRPASTFRQSRQGAAIRHARTCYDHLAGCVGVELTDGLLRQHVIEAAGDSGFVLTPAGERRLGALGLDVGALRRSKRAFARPCLDWTERRPHLAGALGAGVATLLLERGWLTRMPGTRAVRVTTAGRHGLLREFALRVD